MVPHLHGKFQYRTFHCGFDRRVSWAALVFMLSGDGRWPFDIRPKQSPFAAHLEDVTSWLISSKSIYKTIMCERETAMPARQLFLWCIILWIGWPNVMNTHNPMHVLLHPKWISGARKSNKLQFWELLGEIIQYRLEPYFLLSGGDVMSDTHGEALLPALVNLKRRKKIKTYGAGAVPIERSWTL